MHQWLSEIRQNRLLIIPKVLSVFYGIVGSTFLGMVLVVTIISLLNRIVITSNTAEIIAVSVLALVYFGIVLVLFSLAKGFWYYEKWAPGLAIFIHALVMIAQVSSISRSELGTFPQIVFGLLLNGFIIFLLLHSSVRRLFQ